MTAPEITIHLTRIDRPPPFNKYGPSWRVEVRISKRKTPIWRCQYGRKDLAEFAGEQVAYQAKNGLLRNGRPNVNRFGT